MKIHLLDDFDPEKDARGTTIIHNEHLNCLELYASSSFSTRLGVESLQGLILELQDILLRMTLAKTSNTQPKN